MSTTQPGWAYTTDTGPVEAPPADINQMLDSDDW